MVIGRVRSLFLIVILLLLSQSLSAQIVSFASATSVVANGFSESYGLAVDIAGVLYVADTDNNRIVKVMPDGSETVLGTGSLTLSSPHGVAVDTAGDVFIADQGNHRVVKVTPDGEGSVLDTKNYVLDGPAGLALDASGNLFVSDSAYP